MWQRTERIVTSAVVLGRQPELAESACGRPGGRSPEGPGSTLTGMHFVKSHATSNDFVVLPDWDGRLELTPRLVRTLCDRRRGIGADGVIRIVHGESGDDAFMDYRNADGSLAQTCGNGLRVVAKHLVDHGLAAARDGVLRIGTRAGSRQVAVHLGSEGRVVQATVDMGPPSFEPTAIPFDAPEGTADVPLLTEAGAWSVTALSMGNPHAVVLVKDVDDAPLETVGAALESHPRFPERTNVEFVQVASGDGPVDEVRVRVWERGVGETPACGSGACAVLAALHRLGVADGALVVRFPGGDVRVSFAPDGGSILLTGAVVEVASGEVDPAWLAAATTREAIQGAAAAVVGS